MPSHYYKRLSLLAAALFSITIFSYSQILVNTTGNTISNNSYVIEYSIGEIAISTLSSSNNDVTQGLLQPSLKVQNPDCGFVNDVIQYFPNPTQNLIRIVGRHDWIKSYNIYQADGKLVARSDYFNNYIDITKLSSGVYFVVLYPGCDGKFKTLKILKQ